MAEIWHMLLKRTKFQNIWSMQTQKRSFQILDYLVFSALKC